MDSRVNELQALLLKKIKSGEGENLDFKFAINDSRKLAITLSAFSNTSGGTLLIGVKDNGSIAGVNPEEELHMVQGAAELYCSPPLQFTFQVHVVNGKTILETNFGEAENKPVKAIENDSVMRAYERVGSENRLASSVRVQYWLTADNPKTGNYKHTAKSKKIFETLEINPGATLNQLCKSTKIYRPVLIKILANLLRWELIEIRYRQDKEHFFVR